ncbi:MAG: MFS transporter, partial [Chloroflexi bacterium]|nr:MFS transporter [Chloroflexota bacterium]
LVGAFLFQGAGLVLMPFAGNLAVLVVGATIYSIGSGLAGPAINGWSSREVPDRLHGSLFGLLQSARSIGFIVGPTIGGALFDRSPYVPYVVAGVASASAAILVGTMPSVAESKARA